MSKLKTAVVEHIQKRRNDLADELAAIEQRVGEIRVELADLVSAARFFGVELIVPKLEQIEQYPAPRSSKRHRVAKRERRGWHKTSERQL